MATPNMREKAGDVAEKVEDKARQAGEKVQEFGERVQERASRAAGHVEDKTNQGVHTLGEYLSEHDVRDMAGDFANLVKKHPIVSIAVGLGIGLLIASMFRR